ncbi:MULTISPECIES: hypothetical protein [Citrobacter]|uniref:hypothetical protein n=1 Tax=Citrobacter TaxID=544 RepID=UPI001BCDBD76|nr:MULTISPECIES: hypothetical protein [Citrobacter]MCK2155629.1 hypothetical protein [Citrobacter braakii]HBM9260387.1 hypothetical protein [Citrobacter freundii]
MSDNKEFRQRIAEISKNAHLVTSYCSDAQFDHNGYIQDPELRITSMMEAAKADPIFEGVPESVQRSVLSAWGSAIAEYSNKHRCSPRPEVLAAAHQTLENCLLMENVQSGQKSLNDIMLESINAEVMSSQDGIIRQPIFLAMILPVALGAQTGDACTFIPVPRDKSKIYEIINVAGTTFGDFKQGDQLDMQSVGQYAQMRRNYVLQTKGDGVKTSFTFKISDFENGKEIPIRKGRSVIYINNESTDVDAASGNSGQIIYSFANADGQQNVLTGVVDYGKGQIDLTFSKPLDSGIELEAEVEINIEAAPEYIPVINQEMREWTVYPSQYALAAEHSVMAAYDAQREFGIDLGSLQYRTLKDYLSHEQDMLRLRTMIRRCKHTDTYDVAIPQDTNLDVWTMMFKGKVQQVFRDIAERTRTTGSVGMFAGADAAGFIKMLPPTMFTAAENYTQVPYVHFIGTLFNGIKVFEIPSGVCTAFTASGIEFHSYDILCYCRDENPGKAGFITGDAVPVIPFKHPTTPALVDRTTLWGSSINRIHPRNGQDYFTLFTLTSLKVGGLNFRTGGVIESSSSN